MSCNKGNGPISLGLIGYGKFGKEIEKEAREQGFALACILRKKNSLQELKNADVIIDVASSEGIEERIFQALLWKKPIIIGTTGWDEKIPQVKEKVLHADGTVLYSPNFSLGVFFFSKIVATAALWHKAFPEYDVAGMEIHHKNKLDKPSGTAKKLGNLFSQDIDFHSIRMGNFSGTHSIVFDSFSDTITLTHNARSRKGFVEGILQAAKWIIDKKGWLTLEDMFRTLHGTHHSF